MTRGIPGVGTQRTAGKVYPGKRLRASATIWSTCSFRVRRVVSIRMASGGRAQRRHRSIGVLIVPGSQSSTFPGNPGLVPGPTLLRKAAPCPLVGGGGQEDLQVGLREDHGADIAPVHHDTGRMIGHCAPLVPVDPYAHVGERRQARHPLRHTGRPDRLLDVHPGHLRPERLPGQHQPDRQVFGQGEQTLGGPLRLAQVIEPDEGQGAVQRPGIEMRPTPVARLLARP